MFKKIYFLIFILVCLFIFPNLSFEQSYISGEVTGKWTKANSPYIVTGDVIVRDTLFVEPGVEVLVENNYSITVYSIMAIGTENEWITFTRRYSGEWKGIRIVEHSQKNTLEYCIIEYAHSEKEGGGLYVEQTPITISNCIIRNNKSDKYGGGCFIEDVSDDTSYIKNCIFEFNESWEDGGGLYVNHTNIVIEWNIFKSNRISDGSGSTGGAIKIGGSVKSNFILVKRNVFVENSAVYGGGAIFCEGKPTVPSIINNTFVSNYGGGTKGNAIACYSSDIIVKNCILWDGGGELFEGLNSHIEQSYNYMDDPLFSDDYHLSSDSPCIDAGDPTSPLDPDGTRADIGAYYFHQGDITPPATPAKLNAISGDQKIILSWAPNSETDLSYYKIYRSQNQGFIPSTNDSLAIVFKPDTSYTDTNVVNGQTYYYRISAVDSSGNESDFSDEVSATPKAVVTPANIVLSASSYDFGSVFLDSSKTWTFFIKNSGQEFLEIYSINNTQSVFTANSTSGTIHENDSLEITISFTPGVEMVYQDTFKIFSNDLDEPIAQMIVKGQGVSAPKPAIYLANNAYDFGDVPVFSASSWQLTVQNKGTADLQIQDILSDNSVFNVSNTRFSLTPESQQSVQINFSPDSVNTETGTLTIISNDPDQSQLQVSLRGTGIDNQAPEINVQLPSQTIWVNSDFQVSAQVTDNWKVSSVLLYYRKGTDTDFNYITMSLGQDSIYKATIPASAMSFTGIEYYIKAIDGVGQTTISDTLSPELNFADGFMTTNIQYSAYSSGYPRGQWHKLSLPAVLNAPSVGSVLGDETELGSYGEPNWRLFSYEDTNNDGIKDGYLEYNSGSESANFQFICGKAFWLKANPEGEKIEIDAGAGHILPLKSKTITLKPGWNQIGDPFAFPIKFLPDGNNITDKLYFPDGTGGYELRETMQPWTGYFVYVNGNESVNLKLDPVYSSVLRKFEVSDAEWLIQLSACSNQSEDKINYFGISEFSSNEWDKKDYPEPPVIGDYVSLRFPHPDWSEFCKYYTADIRSKIDDGQIWDFEIVTNQANSDITLNWEKIRNLDSDLKMTLYDKSHNKTVDMNIDNKYTFSPLDNKLVSKFQIFVGDQNFIEHQLKEIRSQLPEKYRLYQNFPNPFNATTRINYELPKADHIKLEIFNLQGQKIRTLMNENKSAGVYDAFWDGKNENGKSMVSGTYIYRITTSDFQQSRKMILLK